MRDYPSLRGGVERPGTVLARLVDLRAEVHTLHAVLARERARSSELQHRADAL